MNKKPHSGNLSDTCFRNPAKFENKSFQIASKGKLFFYREIHLLLER
ncbi:hypothetical protein X777_15542 [Ooceraea biroi]|uniref:Uncharacterized protein n=1 Tax=Ooceraea biroi TaxID=2015173 RepID=A0A026X625_OOCBI|nr:hypothetical protein X777_15542 [Ooceraea biroi]